MAALPSDSANEFDASRVLEFQRCRAFCHAGHIRVLGPWVSPPQLPASTVHGAKHQKGITRELWQKPTTLAFMVTRNRSKCFQSNSDFLDVTPSRQQRQGAPTKAAYYSDILRTFTPIEKNSKKFSFANNLWDEMGLKSIQFPTFPWKFFHFSISVRRLKGLQRDLKAQQSHHPADSTYMERVRMYPVWVHGSSTPTLSEVDAGISRSGVDGAPGPICHHTKHKAN